MLAAVANADLRRDRRAAAPGAVPRRRACWRRSRRRACGPTDADEAGAPDLGLRRLGRASGERRARRAAAAPAIDGGRLRARIEQLSAFGRPAGGTFAAGVSRVAYSDADVAAPGVAPRRDPRRRPRRRGSIRPATSSSRVGDGADRRAADPVRLAHRLGAGRRQLRRRPRHAGGARGHPGASGRRNVTTRHPLEMVAVGARGEHRLRHAAPPAAASSPATCRPAISIRNGTGCAARDAHPAASAAIPSASRTRCGRRAPGTPTSSCTSSRAARSIATASPIGVVEGIVAIHRYDVVVTGLANHAGTTPMAERQDALIAASHLVARRPRDRDGARRAAGRHRRPARRRRRIRPNVIPGAVTSERRVARPVGGDARPHSARRSARARRNRARDRHRDHHDAGARNPPALAHAGVQRAIGRAAERARPDARRAAQRRRARRADDRRARARWA